MSLSTLVRRGDPLELAQRDFDTMLGRLFGSRLLDGGSDYLAPYAVDVREDADHIVVEADLPGFQKDEIDVNIQNQALTITAEHKKESKAQEGSEGQWLLRERRYSRFMRSFTLPPTVDPQSVAAKLNDGVLKIILNKREETKPKRITVS